MNDGDMVQNKKQLHVLFLDDSSERHQQFRMRAKSLFPNGVVTYTTTAEEAKKAMLEHRFDIVFLDYDLELTSTLQEPSISNPIMLISYWKAVDKENGYAVAKFISELDENRIPLIVIHSMNPIGAERMAAVLKRRTSDIYVLPFDTWKR